MAKRLSIKEKLQAAHQVYAEKNRKIFARHKILAVNLLASPGAGKTTLIEAVNLELKADFPLGVIEGDLAGNIDQERLKAKGIAVAQINTGRGCHLNALMVNQVIKQLPLKELSCVVIENVGNLVCPSGVPLGEDLNLVVLSLTEGEDKPLKYPVIFHYADLVLLNKLDLLPHLKVEPEKIRKAVWGINPELLVLPVSALSGEGISEFAAWLKAKIKLKRES